MCIIAIDYDGTISADYKKAKDAIDKLKDNGHRIVIWSSRNNPRQHGENKDKLMDEMIFYLNQYHIKYDEIDIGDIGKFHAQVYIDDKAIKFENNWNEIIERIY